MKHGFQYIASLIITIVLLLGYSCNECNLASELILTEQQKKQNPFSGDEKIIYQFQDTLIEFFGNGRSNWQQEVLVSTYGCDYNVYEHDVTLFDNNKFGLSYSMLGRTDFQIEILYKLYDFSLLSQLELDQSTGEISRYTKFIDSLEVNNTQYASIYKDTLDLLIGDEISIDTMKHAIYIYYSTDYGVIKIDFSDGSTWELEEIVW
jgi:hypothetical protein